MEGGVGSGCPGASWLLPWSHLMECKLIGRRHVHWVLTEAHMTWRLEGGCQGRRSVSLRVAGLAVAFPGQKDPLWGLDDELALPECIGQKPILGRPSWYRGETEAQREEGACLGITQHLKVPNCLPCSRLHKNCKSQTFTLHTLVCLRGCLWGMVCRPSSCHHALEGVPSPALPRLPTLWSAEVTHMERPQTSRRHSLITPSAALPLTVHRRFSIPAWRSPRHSENIHDTAQLPSPWGPPSSAISARTQDGQAGGLALRKIAFSLYQAMPQRKPRIVCSWAWSRPSLPFQKGEQKAWGQPAVGRGAMMQI